MKVIAYLRVSTDKQAEHGQGLDVQRAAITAWAKEHGHKIVAWYADEGVSGSNGLASRPGLHEAVWTALREPGTGGLVVYRLDRLARDVILQETLLRDDIRPYGELFSTVPSEQEQLADDPADPGRKMVRIILGAVAGYERDLIKLRLHGGRAAKHERGGYAYGAPPLGQRAQDGELVPDPAEQAALARMRELHAGGQSLRQIIAALEAEGYRTKRGGRWHPSTVARALDGSDQPQRARAPRKQRSAPATQPPASVPAGASIGRTASPAPAPAPAALEPQPEPGPMEPGPACPHSVEWRTEAGDCGKCGEWVQ